jgi:hypothetical protein
VRRAEDDHEVAVARVAELAATYVALVDAARQAEDALAAIDDDPGEPEPETSSSEEVEWYLLARLAAQRAVSLAGSVPLLIDHALPDLDRTELGHLLDRLEHMAETVQVIIVTEDPVTGAWAEGSDEMRVALVEATPA